MDISMNIVDRVIAENIFDSLEFAEYCQNLDMINILTDTELYLNEAMDQNSVNNKTLSKIVTNTAKTTKDLANIYGLTTDAGGAGIKSIWDLVMKLISLAAKALKFIVGKIILVPKLIVQIIDIIQTIPTNVKNKIRGNIQLYITIEDVEILMNQFILNHIITFMNYAQQLSVGESWTTFFHRGQGSSASNKTDMKLISDMNKEFKIFSKLTFHKTTVDMNDSTVVEGYFGKGKIVYKDMHGNQHNETYYGTLKELMEIVSSNKSFLDKIYSAIGNKINTTQLNQSFGSLNSIQRNSIINSMGMVSMATQILGNLVRYVITDMNTIKKSTEQIMKRQSAIENGTARKKIIGRSDNGIKDLDVNNEPAADIQHDEDMKKKGYVQIERYMKDKTGKVIKEIPGQEDPYNKETVWVKKENVPKGAKRL